MEKSFVVDVIHSDAFKIVILSLTTLALPLGGWLIRKMLKTWKEFRGVLNWMRLELKTMDSAIAKSFGNGYMGYKKEAKDKILEKIRDKKEIQDSDFDIEL